MITSDVISGELPLMDDEELQVSFSDGHGLDNGAMIYNDAIVLTNHRLMRLTKVSTRWGMSIISLRDVQVAEIRLIPRGIKPLLRIALLFAGAVAALLTINFPVVSLPLATILSLAGSHRLFYYVRASGGGSIHFRTSQEELEIGFNGGIAEQAYGFVNSFFQIKESFVYNHGGSGVITEERVGSEVSDNLESVGMNFVDAEEHHSTNPAGDPMKSTEEAKETD